MIHVFFVMLVLFSNMPFSSAQYAYDGQLELATIKGVDGESPFKVKILDEKKIELTVSVFLECDQDFVGILVEKLPKEENHHFEVSYEVRAIARMNDNQCKQDGKFIESSVALRLYWASRQNFIAIQP